MNTKKYMPVDCDFHDQLESHASKKAHIRINYWKNKGEMAQVKSQIKDIYATSQKEEYLVTHEGENIRLDHIIAINGKPGPAMDEYEDYANACLDCRPPE